MRAWRERAESEHLSAQVGRARGRSSNSSSSSVVTPPVEPTGQGAGRRDPPEDAQQQAGDEQRAEGARHDHRRLQGGQVAKQTGDASHHRVDASVGAFPARHARSQLGSIPRAGRRLVVGFGLWGRGGLGSASEDSGRGQEREQQQQQQRWRRWRWQGAHGALCARTVRRSASGRLAPRRPAPGSPAAGAAARCSAGSCRARKNPRRRGSHQHVAQSHSTGFGPAWAGQTSAGSPLRSAPGWPRLIRT